MIMSLPQTPCLGAMTETPALDAQGLGWDNLRNTVF